MEIKVTINAPELCAAIGSLADALRAVRLVEPVRRELVKSEPVKQQPVAEPVKQEPVKPAVTLEEIMRAGVALLDSNPRALVKTQELMTSMGVRALTDLKPNQLDAFASGLRAIGAEI